MSRLVLPVTCLLVACAMAASPRDARAQAPSQAEVDRAIALGHEGRTLYEAGDFAGALERFRAADRIARSPVLVLYVARCERNLGRLVAAREAYRRAAEDPLAPDAPPPFRSAQADAQRELSALEQRMPRVQLEGAAGLRVTLDGVLLPSDAAGAAIPVDPGEHVVVALGGPAGRVERRFRAVEAAPVVTIDLSAAPATGAGAAAPAPGPPPGPRRSEGTVIPGMIGLGVGAAGLGLGIATGLVASAKTSDIESRCVGTSCLASDAGEADTARTFATVSTIGFIVGGVGVASGVVLLFAFSGDDEQAAGPPRAAVAIGPSEVQATLRF